MAWRRREAFETDFWKDANLRKAWDDIVPGEPRKTIPYTLTKEAIELYCKSVGEDHPIYFDEAYAKTTRYGGLIAPPSIHILLMFSCTPADDWMRSPGTVNAGQSWSYNIPARPNDVITLQARALDKFIKRERLFVVHDNVFFNQQRRGDLLRPRLDDPAGMRGGRHDHDVRKSQRRRRHRRARHSRSARESIRLFCDASLDYNPLHLDDDYMKGSFRQDQFRRHHHARHEQFRADLAHDHRLGLSRRRHPPPAGNALGQAGEARRHHPAHRVIKSKQVDRKIRAGC